MSTESLAVAWSKKFYPSHKIFSQCDLALIMEQRRLSWEACEEHYRESHSKDQQKVEESDLAKCIQAKIDLWHCTDNGSCDHCDIQAVLDEFSARLSGVTLTAGDESEEPLKPNEIATHVLIAKSNVKLKDRIAELEEDVRFYRNEWESACERAAYAKEIERERDGARAALADADEMHKQEVQRLKALNYRVVAQRQIAVEALKETAACIKCGECHVRAEDTLKKPGVI